LGESIPPPGPARRMLDEGDEEEEEGSAANGEVDGVCGVNGMDDGAVATTLKWEAKNAACEEEVVFVATDGGEVDRAMANSPSPSPTP